MSRRGPEASCPFRGAFFGWPFSDGLSRGLFRMALQKRRTVRGLARDRARSDEMTPERPQRDRRALFRMVLQRRSEDPRGAPRKGLLQVLARIRFPSPALPPGPRGDLFSTRSPGSKGHETAQVPFSRGLFEAPFRGGLFDGVVSNDDVQRDRLREVSKGPLCWALCARGSLPTGLFSAAGPQIALSKNPNLFAKKLAERRPGGEHSGVASRRVLSRWSPPRGRDGTRGAEPADALVDRLRTLNGP
mmetsp:Transcript_7734/g.27428  ORF Transcript_7734/g.27428 Transcript_7734/m.27428 type:complete len:246 (-) Transcript_7734:977-1714(-)